MILVTVGSQEPMDRLVEAVDRWAELRRRTDVFAQVGRTDHVPTHIRWTRFLEPRDFRERVRRADLVVAHAGVGSILTALDCGKPILVMPRRADRHETRTDHQWATARYLEQRGLVHVAWDETEIARRLDVASAPSLRVPSDSPSAAELLRALREFVDDDEPPRFPPVLGGFFRRRSGGDARGLAS